jgi:UDP-N-acetylmuramoyl-L-alanyl-D-glutamate--2,6-diaminopimelate ligase
MRLSQVIAGTGAEGAPDQDPDVSVVTCDSRAVGPGALFFALRGVKADGHDFAAAAARAGATAIVAERPLAVAVPVLLAGNARRAMALAAANLHGRPADALTLVGVTGTNGKTTVTWLVEACARAAGVPAGLVGTVRWRHPGADRPASHTTPESTDLQALLAEMRDAGARLAAIEVSSHALAQERAAGLSFRAAGFTNLTRDHLDYHGDMEAYFASKRRLFRECLAEGGVAVVNAGDAYGARLAEELRREGRTVWRFGLGCPGCEDGAELVARGARVTLAGIEAELATPAGAVALRSPLVGQHNLENLVCAAGLALAAGLPPAAVERGLAGCAGAPGRLERVEKDGVRLFVDYAHTDDALARALDALRALAPRRLACVFGCGGDRDRGKRPLMGAAAGGRADLVVATSDNPRSEDPLAILDEIVPGLERAGRRRLSAGEAERGADGYVVVPDRREAIRLAARAARPGDAVLVAGKGHEDYQLVAGEKRHFDDREEARRALGLA